MRRALDGPPPQHCGDERQPIDGRRVVANTMPSQDSNDYRRMFEPIMAPTLVDNALLELPRNVLTALASGTPAWFADVFAIRRKSATSATRGAARCLL